MPVPVTSTSHPPTSSAPWGAASSKKGPPTARFRSVHAEHSTASPPDIPPAHAHVSHRNRLRQRWKNERSSLPVAGSAQGRKRVGILFGRERSDQSDDSAIGKTGPMDPDVFRSEASGGLDRSPRVARQRVNHIGQSPGEPDTRAVARRRGEGYRRGGSTSVLRAGFGTVITIYVYRCRSPPRSPSSFAHHCQKFEFSATTSARVGYITKLLWGQRRPPGDSEIE